MRSPSPPPSNLLLDPLTELSQVISVNAFGLAPLPTPQASVGGGGEGSSFAPQGTRLLLESSFPITPEDRERIARETVRSGEIQGGVEARAVLVLLEGEGEAWVVLDKRGYTLLEAIDGSGNKTYPNTTFESLEALLIAHSPAYVRAMTAEIERRFTSGDFGQLLAEAGAGEGDATDAELEEQARADAEEIAMAMGQRQGEFARDGAGNASEDGVGQGKA